MTKSYRLTGPFTQFGTMANLALSRYLEANLKAEIDVSRGSEFLATALSSTGEDLGYKYVSTHKPLGAAQKLTNAEIATGITSRALCTLRLTDRSTLHSETPVDLSVFPTDYDGKILYHQGQHQPDSARKKAKLVYQQKN